MLYFRDFDFSLLEEKAWKKGNFIIKKKKNSEGETVEETISNLIFTFDIETTSYFITKENNIMNFDFSKSPTWYRENIEIKQSLMYIWQFSIEKEVIYGRTWKDFTEMLLLLRKALGEQKIIIFVHNLSFEFQFLRNVITDFVVFSREIRKPITAYSPSKNLEFRCSLFLTNKKLESVGKEYGLEFNKKEKINYNIIRTPLTQLSQEELEYCEFDCLVVFALISKFKERYKSVEKIPLTQTSIVRRELLRRLYKEKKHHNLIKSISPSYKEFKLLNQCFMGGYTHANFLHSGKICKEVYSYDITSSYPYVCCVEKFPMTKFTKSTKKLSEINFEEYSVIVDATFENIESTTSNRFLPTSKAVGQVSGGKFDNGRIIKADIIRFKLCDTDLEIAMKTYKWKKVQINAIYTAKKEYLPQKIILFILELFNNKTIFDGIDDDLYREAKEMLNSIYGMFVTKILTDIIDFKENWEKVELTEEMATEKLIELSEKEGQNLSFAWGVWVAAYARKHLWDLILKLRDFVIYCDTDCIKFFGIENIKFFEEDSEIVRKKIKKAIFECNSRKEVSYDELIEESMFYPTTPKGKQKFLGRFTPDGVYIEFKTLGAKKYCYCDSEGKLNITVSGIDKREGAKMLKKVSEFKENTIFTYEYANKLILSYNDNQNTNIRFSDGWVENSKFGINLMPTTYRLSITEEYNELINNSVIEGFYGILDAGILRR